MNKDIKDHPLLLTVPQAADMLQIGRDQVYNLCHVDGFPVIHFGRNVRINRAGLQDWLDKNNGGMIL